MQWFGRALTGLMTVLCVTACGAKSEATAVVCGAQGQACCASSRCEADAGLTCRQSVCALETPVTLGQTCVTHTDCQKDVCTTIGDRYACSEACDAGTGCSVDGWVCDSVKAECTCTPTAELCNGKDDDCNGVIDEGGANADCNAQISGSSCIDAACQCPAGQTNCNNVCVDMSSDAVHCGSCEHACASGEICTLSQCERPSCKGLLQCAGESCCTTLPVPGGTFPMGRSLSGTDAYPQSVYDDELPEHNVTVSAFSLDKFQATVGRLRNFVAAYDAWRAAGHPAAGEGVHPRILGTGWQSSWTLPADAAALAASFLCNTASGQNIWTDSPSGKEDHAQNCLSWNVAFAFCLWDGGRLPTEAEWEFAAAGGDENRLFPWGGTAAQYPNKLACPAEAECDWPSPVGLKPQGNGRYGHAGLAGYWSDWVFDGFGRDWYKAGGATCVDCANLDDSAGRVGRAGSPLAFSLRAVWREGGGGTPDFPINAVRCARD